MGWLRDLMILVEPPIPSFGRLAADALDHPTWPSDLTPKPRSLAALFSKLDHEQDLDWLRDRLPVQQVLADILRRPLGDIRLAIGETPRATEGRYLRLTDVRFARELDLTREDLPPGIPREVLTPASYGISFWIAPPGSGRGLVARFLTARGLAHTAVVQRREDLAKLSSRGPLFIDLRLTSDETAELLSEAYLETLRAPARPVCFAGAHLPASWSHQVITCPSPLDYLPELVDWVRDRLDETGHFQADRAETWLRRTAIPAGSAKTFGDVLGLLGLLDEVHPRSLLAKSLDEVAEHFVRRRVRESQDNAGRDPKIADRAFDGLKECAARSLVEDTETLTSTHSIAEWTEFLTTGQDKTIPDPEWFTEALSGALGTQISRRDLRRAARKLEPGAFQLVRALSDAGLLAPVSPSHAPSESPDSEQALQLRPRWLCTLLTARAAQETLRLAPSQWGLVLLSGKQSQKVTFALTEAAARADFQPMFAAVDDFEPDIPELVAALEAAVIVGGLTQLTGGRIPEELAEGLVERAAECLLSVNACPEPRLTAEDTGTGIYSRSFFLCALLSLTEHQALPLRGLDPHRSPRPSLLSHFEKAADEVLRVHLDNVALSTGLLLLLARMQALVGDEASPRDRLLPLTLLSSLASQNEPSGLQTLLTFYGVEAWLACGVQLGLPERSLLSSLWTALRDSRDLAFPGLSKTLGERVWQNAPTDVLAHRTSARLPIAYSNLLPHQYSEWLKQAAPPDLSPGFIDHCPPDLLLAHVESRGLDSLSVDSARLVVDKLGAKLRPHLRALLQPTQLPSLARLFTVSSPRVSTALVAALPDTSDLLSLAPEVLELVREFLLKCVRRRDPGFEIAYERLMALENKLHPLRALL